MDRLNLQYKNSLTGFIIHDHYSTAWLIRRNSLKLPKPNFRHLYVSQKLQFQSDALFAHLSDQWLSFSSYVSVVHHGACENNPTSDYLYQHNVIGKHI